MSSFGAPFGFSLGGNVAVKVLFAGAGGADIQLSRNSNTGKFDLSWDASGNPVFDDLSSHAVMSRIYSRKGQYWADATGGRGSFMYSVKELKKTTATQAQAYFEDALQPLIDSGRIKKPAGTDFVKVARNAFNRNRLDVTINYSTSVGPSSVRMAIGY